jgi:hypothetical protein
LDLDLNLGEAILERAIKSIKGRFIDENCLDDEPYPCKSVVEGK